MKMLNRFYNGSDYRYVFNGKEKDNEIKGDGNSIDYGFRIYDPRIGRFFSEDPLTGDYPWYTPYKFAGNTPIQAIDLDGLEEYHYTLKEDNKGNTVFKLVDVERYNKHNFFGVKWQTKIETVRHVVHFTGITSNHSGDYYIGFAGPNGAGNGSPEAKGIFRMWKLSPNVDTFRSLFYREDESRANWKEQNRGEFLAQLSFGLIARPDGAIGMVGENGTQIQSKTVWQQKGSKARIDVENPNPGQRPGQVHYQDAKNNKYTYDLNERQFYSQNPETKLYDMPAPHVNKLMENPEFKKGLDKGLKYLGELNN